MLTMEDDSHPLPSQVPMKDHSGMEAQIRSGGRVCQYAKAESLFSHLAIGWGKRQWPASGLVVGNALEHY